MELNYNYNSEDEYICEALKQGDSYVFRPYEKLDNLKGNIVKALTDKGDPLQDYFDRQNKEKKKKEEAEAKKAQEAALKSKMEKDAEAAYNAARASEKTTPYIKGGKDKNRLINPKSGKGYGGPVRKNMYGKNFGTGDTGKDEQVYKKLFPTPTKKYKLNNVTQVGKKNLTPDPVRNVIKNKYAPNRKPLGLVGKAKKFLGLSKKKRAKLKESFGINLNYRYK